MDLKMISKDKMCIHVYYIIFDHNTMGIYNNKTFDCYDDALDSLPESWEDLAEHGYEIIKTEVFSYALRRAIDKFNDLISVDDLAKDQEIEVREVFGEIYKALGYNHPKATYLSSIFAMLHSELNYLI